MPLIVPADGDIRRPIWLVPLSNDPALFDNCARKTFDDPKVPVIVYGTASAAFLQSAVVPSDATPMVTRRSESRNASCTPPRVVWKAAPPAMPSDSVRPQAMMSPALLPPATTVMRRSMSRAVPP